MQKIRYSQRPRSLHVEHHRGFVLVTVTANAVPVAGAPGQWEADSHRFWESAGELDWAALRANPAAFLHYVTSATRREAQRQARLMLERHRDSSPRVPVPSYRQGTAVTNSLAEQLRLLAGTVLGGLSHYELADGEVVQLSANELRAILADIAAEESRLLLARQRCLETIENAPRQELIEAALADFAGQLAVCRQS